MFRNSPLTRQLRQATLAFAAAMPLATVLALPVVVLPAAAQTQAAPQINSFEVRAPDRVLPGDEIEFTLRGSPGASARVELAGLQRSISLREVRSGVYEGSHVLRRNESLDRALRADATLSLTTRQGAREHTRETTQQWARKAAAGNSGALACAECGRVTAVERVRVRGDGNNVAGTIIGGVVGGVAGNQVGGGSGRDVARIAGVLGGAYAGNRIQNRNNIEEVWRVSVRMDDGSTRQFDYANDPAVASGTPVRVQDGVLVRL